MNEALNAGWKVRICFDSVLRVPDWESIYQAMIKEVFTTLSGKKVFDFSIGVFRMNLRYLERLRKERKDSAVLFYPYTKRSKLYTYTVSETDKVFSFIESCIRDYHPDARIYVVTT